MTANSVLVSRMADTGIVVVLDNRVLAKRYGQAFLDALPKCPMEVVLKKAVFVFGFLQTRPIYIHIIFTTFIYLYDN